MKFIITITTLLFCTAMNAQDNSEANRKSYIKEVSRFPLIKIEKLGASLEEMVVIEPVLISNRQWFLRTYSSVPTSCNIGPRLKGKSIHKQKTNYIASLLSPKNL